MSTPDERRIDDRIRAVFDEPVTPLSPPPGTWQRIERDAARRTRARRLRAAGSVAAGVALLGTGAAWLGLASDRSGPITPEPAPSVVTPTPGPSPSRTPSRTPSPQATVTPSGSAAALPRGGPVPAGFVAVSASTTPEGYVYALGTAPCSTGPCTSLVRSGDGGATWVGVPAPRAGLPPGVTDGTRLLGARPADTVSEIRFATQRDGWAFGGGLWATHDGGATWREVRGIRGRVLDLVTDGDDVYAVTSDCVEVECARGSRTRLLRTRASGGDVTEVLTVSGVWEARFGSGSGTFVLTLGAWDDYRVLFLRDGRWAPVPAPCPSASNLGVLDVVAPASGGGGLVAFCGHAGATGDTMFATVRRSVDGDSWVTIGEEHWLSAGGGGSFSGTAVTVDRLVLATGRLDQDGLIQVSYQGGREWFDSRVAAPPKGWRWVAAAGGDRVLALPLVATGDLYVSTDGGRSFAARTIR